MSEQGVKAQGASEGRRWTMLAAGVIVYAISFVGAFTSEGWAEYFGLSWSTMATVVILVMIFGCVSFLYGLQVYSGLADDKPDPLTAVVRELAGLRQEVAALRVHLERGAQR